MNQEYRDAMKKKNNLGKMIDHYFAEHGPYRDNAIQPILDEYAALDKFLSEDKRKA